MFNNVQSNKNKVMFYIFVVSHVVAMRFARIEKKILASMFSSEIVRNCLIFLESFPFGIRYPSVNCQHGAADPFFHSARMSVHMRLSSLGHLLYTVYCIPFGPGAEQERAFYTTSVTFFHVGPSMSSGMQCSLTVAIMSQFPSGVSFCWSACVLLRNSSTSVRLLSSFQDFSSSKTVLEKLNGLEMNAALF